MPDHQYLDVFLKEEDRMAKDMLRGFVEKEIMPLRQKIDGDKEFKTVSKVLQRLTDIGIQKGAFPKEYGGGGAHTHGRSGCGKCPGSFRDGTEIHR